MLTRKITDLMRINRRLRRGVALYLGHPLLPACCEREPAIMFLPEGIPVRAAPRLPSRVQQCAARGEGDEDRDRRLFKIHTVAG